MSMYFNAVFFGSNSYGIKAAANTFFGKHPKVDIAQQQPYSGLQISAEAPGENTCHYEKQNRQNQQIKIQLVMAVTAGHKALPAFSHAIILSQIIIFTGSLGTVKAYLLFLASSESRTIFSQRAA